MLSYILYSILAILFLYILRLQFKYRHIRNIPGPPSLPFFGAIMLLQDQRKALKKVLWLFKKFGPVIKIPIDGQMVIGTIDRDVTEFFLRSPKFITKLDQYNYLDPWLGKGILNANGREWQKTRKMVTPAFHFRILEDHCKLFDSACDVLIDILYDKLDKDICDIHPIITAFTLDIIAETAMGIKINMQKEPDEDYINAVHFMTDIPLKRALSCWKGYEFLFRFSKDYRTQRKSIKILDDMTIKLIKERQKYLLENRDLLENNEEQLKRFIFLDILLTSEFNGEPLTDEKIRIEVNNFMFGGHDTTASTISIMMYELANNLEVQNKIVEELKTIYGNDKNRYSTMQDLHDMKYMDLVIKEVLRYYSIVPLIGRKITEDVDLNGYKFPKDIGIVFFIYGLNKNPEVFKDPHIFNPERFLDEVNIKPYSFIPFSAGPRNCMGQKYAVLEIKATISRLLRHFEFMSAGPKHKLELVPELVMKPYNGIMMKFKQRDF